LIELTAEDIAQACGARIVARPDPERLLDADVPRRAVVDSRAVEPGDLFFGIRGERSEGGSFASEAIEAGAWGVVVRPEHADRASAAAGQAHAHVLTVEDPLAALAGLAGRWLESLRLSGCRVIGITGSTGKTSTKDILLSMLRPVAAGRVHASRENYNTEIGLPLSVLEVEPGTELIVLEMAMRGIGQIRELARIARPDVGLITNVGPVHLELVGTIERVAEAKAELIAELPARASCVVPVAEEALRPHLRSDVKVITFADPAAPGDGNAIAHAAAVAGASADVRALWFEHTESGLRAEVAAGAEREVLEFGFQQVHNLTNALAGIGAAHALGIPLTALAEGARTITFSALRGEELELAGGALIINDCYNANPVSMRAAVDHLAQVASRRKARRTIAVLGEMRELGPESARFHEEVGRQAAAAGVAALVAVGPLAEAYAYGYAGAGEVRSAADADEAAGIVAELLSDGDVLLVKGSRAVGLERVAEALLGEASASETRRDD
jgi:UDP-N-acetylmuramoyl-tripeptide--D-alanyl-D-alanine ligase